jgi:hypothetical protein
MLYMRRKKKTRLDWRKVVCKSPRRFSVLTMMTWSHWFERLRCVVLIRSIAVKLATHAVPAQASPQLSPLPPLTLPNPTPYIACQQLHEEARTLTPPPPPPPLPPPVAPPPQVELAAAAAPPRSSALRCAATSGSSCEAGTQRSAPVLVS